MLAAILLYGVLAGLDNLQVCSSLGLLPVRRARKHLLALAFSACETLAPLVGLALGHAVFSLLPPLAKAGPAMVLLSGLAVLFLALRQEDVAEIANGHGLLFVLPLSLSLDNLLAGAGLGSIHYPILLSALLIGLVSAAMSCAGLYLGAWLRRFIPRRMEIAVGAYLCVLGLRMIFGDAA